MQAYICIVSRRPPYLEIGNLFTPDLKVQSHQIPNFLLGSRKLNHYILSVGPFTAFSYFYVVVPVILKKLFYIKLIFKKRLQIVPILLKATGILKLNFLCLKDLESR
jgi:hypothetical protein